MGENNFAGQYQQQPATARGGMMKQQWLQSYVPGQEPLVRKNSVRESKSLKNRAFERIQSQGE
jgi:hypothetical protein